MYSLDDGLATKVYMAANPRTPRPADGVLEGIVRQQEHLGDPTCRSSRSIHGDAAFIGQGVVQEDFQPLSPA